ncbi:uncharacterized protein LY89DRAFT_745032 [Mollisia scopiformis]|uniref:RBR-type E3 ubiquitin transferase n=1 Tax=Mollisia scopiformis TaxID=149040 RepID=A0A194XW52_MOLSC|nr:uncharacterized protein LY89DRAFT_745032 [Mollisia scopiformis]KUJ24244.1 hypothetical protein LY89DRAFT_745032 [Mollisia scopiformis]
MATDTSQLSEDEDHSDQTPPPVPRPLSQAFQERTTSIWTWQDLEIPDNLDSTSHRPETSEGPEMSGDSRLPTEVNRYGGRRHFNLRETHDDHERPSSEVLSTARFDEPFRPNNVSTFSAPRDTEARTNPYIRATPPGLLPHSIEQGGLLGASHLPRDCSICEKSIIRESEVVALPCKHEYCIDCFRKLVKESFTQKHLFPPVCWYCPGQTINLVKRFLPDLEEEYLSKSVEFALAPKRRVYCPNCGRFQCEIHNDQKWKDCLTCNTKICTMCKARFHSGECPKDEGDQLLSQLKKQENWQSCPVCGNLVELTGGCPQVTCLCGTQFCYTCGAERKACVGHKANDTVYFRPLNYNQLADRLPTRSTSDGHPDTLEIDAAATGSGSMKDVQSPKSNTLAW